MRALIARKVGMTQIYDSDSNSIAVTVLDASSCRAVQIKSLEKDGYLAAQLTIGNSKKTNNPMASHYSKFDVDPGEGLWEVTIEDSAEIIPGQEISAASVFQPGNLVDITGISKGKGFAGVMKRHNFAGQKASHGVHKVHRAGGSIGNASYPGHVFKGTKMPGRMGGAKTTIQNVQVVAVDEEENFFLVNGTVPGSDGSVVLVSKAVKVDLASQENLSNKYSTKVSELIKRKDDVNDQKLEDANDTKKEEE
jgi:large subunit ribosomal protein L3